MYPLDIPGISGRSLDLFMFDEHATEQTMTQLVGEIPVELEVVFLRSGVSSALRSGRLCDVPTLERSIHPAAWQSRLVDEMGACDR